MVERFLWWATKKATMALVALTLTFWLTTDAVAKTSEPGAVSISDKIFDDEPSGLEDGETVIPETTEEADMPIVDVQPPQPIEVQPLQPVDGQVSDEQSLQTAEETALPAKATGPFAKYGEPNNSEPELLVLRLLVGKNILLSNELLAYQRGNRLSVALGEFVNLIEYPIAVNPQTRTASGWFNAQGNKFHLDISAGKVEIGGRVLDLPPAPLIEIADGDIYVDTRVLGDWFPIGFRASIGGLTLSLNPSVPLPIQARLERERRRKKSNRFKYEAEEVPIEKFEKDWWSVPALDFNYQLRANGGADRKSTIRHDYQVLGEGDLGKMTANAFVSGTDDEIFSVRATLTKEDPDGGMLGPFHAKTITMGDIGAPKTPFVRSRGQDRGLRISNSDIFAEQLFDTTSFGGNLPRGWDVELYHNGILIDTVDIDEEGRYDFDDVPLFFGSNDFEIVSYGPQGQRKVRTSVLHFDPSSIKEGQVEYDLVISEKGKSLIDPLNARSQVDQGSFHFVSQISRGLTDNVSLRASFSSEKFEGKRVNHFNLGTAFTGFGFFGRTDWTHAINGGDAGKLTLQRRFGPVNLRFSRIQYWDFFPDPARDQATDQKHETSFGFITTSKPYKFIPAVTANMEYTRSVREDSVMENYSARLAARIKKVRLTHNLTRTIRKSFGNKEKDTDGQLQATLNLGDLIIRGAVGYEIEPLKEISALGMSGIWEINNDITANLNIDHTLAGTNFTSMTGSMSWDTPYAIFTPSLTYDSDDNYSAFLIVKFGLSHEPINNKVVATSDRRRSSGAVSARVFLDANANNVFDEGDQVLEDVKLRAKSRGRNLKTETDASGVGMITNISRGGATVIEIDEETIEDPFWIPTQENQVVVGRPGTTQIVNFPVVNTGEVDGVVRLDDGQGGEREMGGVEVHLMDQDGNTINTARTAYDGFYLFTLVRPGKYTVQVPKTGKRQSDFLVRPSRPFKITGLGEVKSNIDFLVRTKTALALERELELRRQLDEERALLDDSLGRLPTVLPRRSGGPRRARRIVSVEAQPAQPPVSNASPAPAATPPQAGAPASGLHLASYRSRAAAEEGWRDILSKHTDIVGALTHSVSEVDLGDGKGVYFRLSALTGQQPDAARSVCAQLQQRDQYCAVSTISN